MGCIPGKETNEQQDTEKAHNDQMAEARGQTDLLC